MNIMILLWIQKKNMSHLNNSNKHINNIKEILKHKEEWYDYFHETVHLSRLQKTANIRLFFQKPLICVFRFILYMPVNLLKMVEKANNRFYLAKIKNEIEVLKDELHNIEKNRWIK